MAPASPVEAVRQVSLDSDTPNKNVLWYRQPVHEWVEALPVGNGRLGGMVFGRVDSERIQLNEETVWAGYRGRDRNNPQSLQALPEIRRLLFRDENLANPSGWSGPNPRWCTSGRKPAPPIPWRRCTEASHSTCRPA